MLNDEIKMEYDVPSGRINFYLFNNGKSFIAKPVYFQYDKIEDNSIVEPTFSIDAETLYKSLNDLIKILRGLGFNTPRGTDELVNELKATQYHLEDLRKLIFKDEEDKSEKCPKLQKYPRYPGDEEGEYGNDSFSCI